MLICMNTRTPSMLERFVVSEPSYLKNMVNIFYDPRGLALTTSALALGKSLDNDTLLWSAVATWSAISLYTITSRGTRIYYALRRDNSPTIE